jgi:cysteine desulfurase
MKSSSRTSRIYFDHAATTAVRSEVRDAMEPFFRRCFGNPSSLHAEGQAARDALEVARKSVLETCGAGDFDLVFCSSGTEADNAALIGSALKARGHVVTSAVEHPAVLGALSWLEELGGTATVVGVDRDGRVDPAHITEALRAETSLVSLQAANNETGALQPCEEVGRRAHEQGVLFHTDAIQLLGKSPLRLDALPVDLVTISAHKVYGPKGMAALLIRKGTSFEPLFRGGSQEGGLRAGTENVALAVGFARALELIEGERQELMARLQGVRDRLRDGILERFPGVLINTPAENALPTILNCSFRAVEGESLVRLLDWMGVAASTGSACNVGAKKPSHVLQAMGRTDLEVRGSLRLSLGRSNLEAEVEPFLDSLQKAIRQLEGVAPAM